MKLKPMNDRVVVKRLDAESKTPGGIILPDTAKEKPQRGIVKALGSGKLLESGKRAEMQVKLNDEVIFVSYAGTEVKIHNEEFVIMNESDILAIIE